MDVDTITDLKTSNTNHNNPDNQQVFKALAKK